MKKTAGPIKLFSLPGWAFMWPAKVVHNWIELKDNTYKSRCGVSRVFHANRPPLYGGTWPKCKTCMKLEKTNDTK